MTARRGPFGSEPSERELPPSVEEPLDAGPTHGGFRRRRGRGLLVPGLVVAALLLLVAVLATVIALRPDDGGTTATADASQAVGGPTPSHDASVDPSPETSSSVPTPSVTSSAAPPTTASPTTASPTTAPPSTTAPAVLAWPTSDREGPSSLYAWFGANFEIPDWVSCLDDDSFCIAGIGDEVHVIRLRDLSDVGQAPLDSADPLAVLENGFPEAQARELLRPGGSG